MSELHLGRVFNNLINAFMVSHTLTPAHLGRHQPARVNAARLGSAGHVQRLSRGFAVRAASEASECADRMPRRSSWRSAGRSRGR